MDENNKLLKLSSTTQQVPGFNAEFSLNETSEDLALVNAAISGDRAAFETLVSQHYDFIYAIAYKWCGNQADADDITQTACSKLGRKIESFRGDSTFKTWLYRLVINTAKDWQRQQESSHQQQIADNTTDTESLSTEADNSVYAQQVLTQVYRLPSGEKEALLLVVMEGLTHREAADIIGCKESTVSWRIHEARKKLNHFFNNGAG